jgi:L-ascorbate metabolism protein UlaG (beta-lactamase superfamily)
LWVLAFAAGAGRVAGSEPAATGVTVTYLANEGFLLEAGETRVLVDALFGDGLSGYLSVPPPLRADLEAARGRFSGVDLILVSHAHADHFDPDAVARHLAANPAAVFLSTPQAVAALRDAMGESAVGRNLVPIYPGPGESVTLRPIADALEVTAFNLSHGPLPIENLGLVVRLGGVGVLHVGDTSAEAPELRPYADLLATVGVWLLPDWLMGEAAWEEARGRAPGEPLLVDMHLAAPSAPPSWFGSAGTHAGRIARLRAELPGAWIPVEPLESRRYPAANP